jgi:hypothetical protein
MADFEIKYQWTKRDHPYELDEERLPDSPTLWSTLLRFMAEYKGTFTISHANTELELWFDYDLSQAFDYLPGWLGKIACEPGQEAVLLFASQGTELKLVAVRTGENVALRVVGIGPESTWPEPELPDVFPAGRFLQQWTRFLNAVLGALQEFEPTLADDREFREYCRRINEVGAKLPGFDNPDLNEKM